MNGEEQFALISFSNTIYVTEEGKRDNINGVKFVCCRLDSK